MNPGAKTLLVVDDDAAVRESLEELLRHQGYRVLTAVDGEDGLRMVREQRPDLIVLDVGLPGMDGFRVATLIKRDPVLSQVPIILYSGRLEESFAVLAYETKADYFLPKAGNVRPILDAIRQLLERVSKQSGKE
jgi:DNA-binding response OmpR family regulator